MKNKIFLLNYYLKQYLAVATFVSFKLLAESALRSKSKIPLEPDKKKKT